MASGNYRKGPISFEYHAKSDMGRVRSNNEDSLIEAPHIGLFGVCDGLGGHAAGEVASSIAATTLQELVKDSSEAPGEVLKVGIQEANERILRDQVLNPKHRGMGTTVSLVWLVPGDSRLVWIGHVGDSRIYLMEDSQLSQLTEDHSPVFRLFKQGLLTKDQIQQHPQKNLLERSLGVVPDVEVDVFPINPNPGDRFLICSDGLTDLLSDSEILDTLTRNSFEEALDHLISGANAKGGVDNISVVLLKIVGIEGA